MYLRGLIKLGIGRKMIKLSEVNPDYTKYTHVGVDTETTGVDRYAEVIEVAAQELSVTPQPAVFTEKMFKLGLDLLYKADTWACWTAVDLIAYHTADIESKISTPGGSYTIDVERTDPFIFTLGASIEKAGVNWFSTINIAGESAIRVGANYKF